MTAPPCTLPAEDLLAYADGYLRGGRRELVEAHLTACLFCRERLAAFRDVDRLLKDGTPLSDDPEGRVEIRARLEQANRQGQMLPRLLAAPVLATLLALLLVAGPVAIEAGFPLGRYVTFGDFDVTDLLPEDERKPVEHVAPSDPSVLTLPFRSVEPAALPSDLVLAERSTPKPDRLQLLYRDEDDLAVLITQAPAGPDMVTISNESRMETTLVGETPVLIGRGERPDEVTDLKWEHGDVFFSMRVIGAPTGAYGGLKTADALAIVEAVIAAQVAGQ